MTTGPVPAGDRRPPSTPFLLAVRITLLLGGGVLAALLVATTAYSVAGTLVRTSERADDTLTGRFERVEVRVAGTLEVHPGPPGRAHVVRTSDFSFDRPEVSQRIVDGTLRLSYRCRGLNVVCSHHVELTVPPDVDLDIDADRVVVADTTGSVRIRSGGGSAELERVRGPVDARVGGGAIIGRDLRSSEVRASAGGGSIELSFAAAPEWVDVSAGAGHIALVLPRGPETYQVVADAGVGDAQVRVANDPASPRVVRASAGAGDVVVRYGPE